VGTYKSHGSHAEYVKRGCRCEICVAAVPHGTDSGYANWWCRCRDCKDAHLKAANERYHQDIEESRAKARAKYHQRKAADPEGLARVYRGYSYKKRYGLTHDEYDELMAGPCAICGGESQVLDHDHDTGQIRGALCRACNTGLGQFADDADRVASALTYLKEGGDAA
jgi:hypothetical protein